MDANEARELTLRAKAKLELFYSLKTVEAAAAQGRYLVEFVNDAFNESQLKGWDALGFKVTSTAGGFTVSWGD